MQVADHARELAKHTHLDIATITGGVAYMNHAEVFSENQDIVVATTGRLLQYIKEENFDCRAVETLILDEADRMLDMGFAQDIEHIAGETRWRKQTLLFSATLEGDAIQDFAERLLEDPVEVSANPSTRERKKIHQWYYRADVYSKPWMAFFLAELIAAILVLFGAYQVLDAWIARVSREEREALEARQQAMMAEQQEGGHVSH